MNFKVCSFPGKKINDMHFYLALSLLKKPDKIILHINTNDARFMDANEMLKCVFDLKQVSLIKLPSVKILMSAPTVRNDKANSNEKYNNIIKLIEAAKA